MYHLKFDGLRTNGKHWKPDPGWTCPRCRS